MSQEQQPCPPRKRFPVQVAAAVIRRSDGAILLSLRHQHAHQGGLWEFPGGKLEPSERAVDGLARELSEELGIRIDHAVPLIQIGHNYPDKQVALHVFEVSVWQGYPSGREGQQIRWVAPAHLQKYAFPQANIPIQSATNLPHLSCKLSLAEDDGQMVLQRLRAWLNAGVKLVHLAPSAVAPSDVEYRDIAQIAVRICNDFNAQIILGRAADVVACEAHGLHLNAAQMRQISCRPIPLEYVFTTTCHSLNELEHAQRLGADFVYLSPVRGTPDSRPSRVLLGWHGLKRLVKCARIPAYALGDLTPLDLRLARRVGCQGIAIDAGQVSNYEPRETIRDCALALANSAYAVCSGGV